MYTLWAGRVYAGPQAGVVVRGEAKINQTGTTTSIRQSSSKAIINWQDFSIKDGESVSFIQPNQSSITLNRVLGSNISFINGLLEANGTLFLINQNGIVFGAGSRVNVGGFLASTFDISDDDFLAERYQFNLPGVSDAAINNHGQITIAGAGLAAFVAPHIVHDGVIVANLGRVALAAGQTGFALDLYGDNLIRFALPDEIAAPFESADSLSLTANGLIQADGGQVLITAETAREVVSSIITVGGDIRARSIGMDNGKIILSGQNVYLDGVLDASSDTGEGGAISVTAGKFEGMASGELNVDGTQGGTIQLETTGMAAFSSTLSAKGTESGGRIEVTGDSVILLNGDVDASGGINGGTVNLGGEWQGGGTLAQARETIIGVGSEVLANGASGGEIVVWSTENTEHYGLLQAGDGGQIELSSKGILRLNGTLEAGAGGEVLLDPKNLIIADTSPDTVTMALKVTSGSVAGNPLLIDGDEFGSGVALDGDLLAVGAYLDDTGGADRGAVYLFSGVGTNFTGLTYQKKLASSIGATGMVPLSNGDQFGVGVALDGDLLAVGAYLDDTNAGLFESDLGAVHLFTGVGVDFSGLTYHAKVASSAGAVAMPSLDDGDNFGVSVALDGDLLAIGAYRDAGFLQSDRGAVYLFNGVGTDFSGLTWQETLADGSGAGGTMPSLANGDQFGVSVALSGNLLAVGAYGDDTGGTDRGSVYLFTGTGTDYTGLNYETLLASGQGASNMPGLTNSDRFGVSVALDGDILVVGAFLDDTGGTDRGAVYLFNNVGTDFTTLNYEKKIVSSAGAIGMPVLDNNDHFGVALDLDGGRLAVGSPWDDDGGTDRGAVYLFTGLDSLVAPISVSDAIFTTSPEADSYITPALITALLNAGTAVTLQANNDITVSNAIVTVAGGLGGDLVLQAGRSIFFNGNITTDNGNLTITANETAANGVVDVYRDAGNAEITMGAGMTIDTGSGAFSATLTTGTGNSNTGSGAISLETVIADTINVVNFGPLNGDLILNNSLTAINGGDAIVLRTKGNVTNTFGVGALNPSGGGRYLVFVNDTGNITANGLTAIPWYNTATDASVVGIGTGNRFVSAEVASLTVTADNQTRLYGGVNPAFSQTISGYINGETSAIITGVTGNGSTTATATTNVGTAVITGTTGTLGSDRNYTVSAADGVLTINPAPLAITATGQSKIYGDPLNLGISGFSSVGLVNTETIGSVTLTSTGGYDANTSAAVATYVDDIVASNGSGGSFNPGNYDVTYNTGDLEVTLRAITVTVDNRSKVYGGTLALGTSGFTVANLANAETIGSVTLTSTANIDTDTSAAVATYAGDIGASTAGGGSFNASNYTISYTAGDFSVTPAGLTLTANNEGKTYDGLAYSGGNGVTGTGFVNGESVADLGGSLSYGGTSQGAVDVGSYGITSSGLTSVNYTIAFNDGSLTVNTAPLSITATDAGKIYDGLAYLGGNGVTYSGFVNGETSAVLGGSLIYTGSSQGAVNAGGYVLTPSGLTSSNYAITPVGGALTIDSTPLTVTADNQSKIYGDVLNLGTGLFTSSGLIGAETIGTVTLNSTGSYDSNTTTAVATYVGDIAATGATGGTFTPSNYAITYNTGDLAVTPRSITITANNQSKTYGSILALGATAFSTTNLANGETIGSVTLTSSGGYDANTGTVVGAYVGDISASNPVGGSFNTANYTINYDTGTFSVNRALLNITANNDSKTYDGLAYSGGNGVTYSGFVNSQDSTVLGGTLGYTGNSQSAINVGGYAITPTGYTAANYTLNYLNGSLVVDPRSINLTANPASKVELTFDPPLSMSITGGTLAATDTLAEVSGTVGRERGERTGLYDILLGTGAKAGNYAIAFVADNNAFTISATVEETPVDQNWDTVTPIDVLPSNEDINEILPDYGEPIIVDPLDPSAFLPGDAGQSIPVVEPDVPVPTTGAVVEGVVPEAPAPPAAPEPPAVEPVFQETPPVAPVIIPDPVAVTQDEVDTVFLTFEPDGTVTMDYLSGESIVGISTIDISIDLAEETMIVTRYNPVQGQSIRFATTVSLVFLGDDGPEFKGGYVIADEGDGLTAIPFAFADDGYVKPGITLEKLSFGLTDREGGKITYRVAVAEHDLLITPQNKVAALLAAASPQLIVALTMVEVQKQLDVVLDDIEAVFFKMNVY